MPRYHLAVTVGDPLGQSGFRELFSMKPRSALAQALPRSGIREVMDLARQMDDVIVLVVGEPSFNTPPHIIDAAAQAAHAGTTKYTPNAGLPGLRSAVAERADLLPRLLLQRTLLGWDRPAGSGAGCDIGVCALARPAAPRRAVVASACRVANIPAA